MIRWLKILLASLVSLWGLIGAAGNFAHLDNAYESVRAVTSMPMFGDAAPPWRTENPVVVWLGVAIIIAGKLAAFAFCGTGAVLMSRRATAPAVDFQQAKRWALLGCGLAAAMLFGGFAVIGETLYVMFRNPEAAPAGDAAFRYGGFILLIALFIGQREE